ncbi:MAG: ABC transporter ATP-binding protein [Candidatus Rokuibacteriota bacterium]|nr:MAG: ABC transporter ATP-binding protein [Candidatus Rokubacteria bacterium]PYM53218.1 MAG: ABC transporter ATP-binding protein [Candidatus Rokubacteria bacterium]PYM70786.1 MAG: ABC transporter ATP-binding protein [Candidatus Rokubacteria bacterium]
MTLLAVDALQTFYGKSHVLRDVSFTVPAGEITVLLGRNGAGKTTTLRSIMGLTPPRGGAVRFKDRDITGHAPHEIFHLGIGYVPEGRQIFPHLEVGENLRLAERRVDGDSSWTRERIFTYFPVLQERWRQRGRSLSGGEQQMLAIARALAGNPELLMLDEPSQGLAPRLVRELESLMIRLKAGGVTILLVEQNARMALGVCDQVLVLGKGAVVFAGPTAEFRRREAELKGRYLSV